MAFLRNALPPQMTPDEWNATVRSLTMCVLALIILPSLCVALFFKNYTDPVVLTAVAGLAGSLFGYLAGKRTPVTDPPKNQQTTEPEGNKP